eukprot:298030_1
MCKKWSISPRKAIISIIDSNINDNNNKYLSNALNEAIILAISPPENGKVNTLQVATSTRLIYLGKYESIERFGQQLKLNINYKYLHNNIDLNGDSHDKIKIVYLVKCLLHYG